ncbi:MerR family transcriptional regulator [Agrococcus sp. Marseille-P2731]|uniref:MerR family transcriptional regulator n=1 Tax=Agrococcus sp. Marseille-P2731 TaxID=1841862 RepID=UPI0013566278|nr:MerR family transcriptional regulator [Agrococcus sp. Marseille-P2731]
MTIGDFSRATQLTAKALRFYHGEGLLTPASVDVDSGYRRYAAHQVADAQLIRSLRSLDVSVDDIRKVLTAPDVASRALVLAEHADRLEAQLHQTSASLRTLRGMLEQSEPPVDISSRRQPAAAVLGIEQTIELRDLGSWFRGAVAELRAAVESADARQVGPLGGAWSNALFLEERGAATLFAPISDAGAPSLAGRVRSFTLPAVELAVATSRGADESVSAVYGALGEHVARHALSIDAPLREAYLQGLPGFDEEAVIEIGWPIFRLSG